MSNKLWLKILPILFLISTFENCYYTLNLYTGGLILSVLTTVLLVLAIDSSIYFSMLNRFTPGSDYIGNVRNN